MTSPKLYDTCMSSIPHAASLQSPGLISFSSTPVADTKSAAYIERPFPLLWNLSRNLAFTCPGPGLMLVQHFNI